MTSFGRRIGFATAVESPPYFFTGTAGKTVVRLQPDAPRTLHP